MKKSTLESIRNYLNGDTTVDLSVLIEEVNAEWEQRTAKFEEKKSERSEIAEMVLTILAEATEPMTAQEILDDLEVTQYYTVRKLIWLLTHDLSDKVQRVENGRKALKYKLA